MCNYNKLTIIGNIMADAVLNERMVGGQKTPVTTVTVAVNKQHSETPDIFRVEMWRNLAMSVAPYAKKGRKVVVTGPVTLKSYIDKNNVARYYMAISPDDFIFDDKKPEIEAPADTGAYAVVEDDDDPFAE